ncbi:cysteine hydrolase family protein [Aquibacillus kalidii]|uniref:cysteine hydrolase family protein n=1 Tax=Aquibacillus kalidii TaxID=2762597 RepID=UPI00164856C5|nr:isochorismatase family cysteine hydrolase [Aquibacillus kalidii]
MRDLVFEKENSALLLVNLQNAFLHPEGALSKAGLDGTRLNKVIDPIRQLKEAFQVKKRPVIYMQHTQRPNGADVGLLNDLLPSFQDLEFSMEGTWDCEFIDQLKPDESDYIVKKHRFSSFYQTDLEDLLVKLNVDTLVIAGVPTNVCVESTVRDAYYRDYKIYVPQEATASYTEEQEQWSLSNVEFPFARVVSVKELLHELLVQVI